MEDKWFVYFDEPFLFLHRSWTGQAIYRVKLEAHAQGAIVGEALHGPKAINDDQAEYHAKLLDFLISNLLLKKAKPFPLPKGYDEKVEGVLQHHVSGTGYRQA